MTSVRGAYASKGSANTMSLRKTITRAGLLAALSISCATLAPGSAAAHETQADAQLIVVNGSGEVHVRPDSLRVDVGVEARAVGLQKARTQASRALTSVIEAIHALDLPDVSMETQVISVSPIYSTPRDNKAPTITGYAASNYVTITLRKAPIDELGDRGARIIDTALASGANSVGALQFFLADPQPAIDEALAAAVQDAARDAAIIAHAAGVTLGAVHSVDQTQNVFLSPRAVTIPSMVATPIEVGDIVITSNVTARFAFH